MMSHKTGVAKRIHDLQPNAYPTHALSWALTQLKCKGHQEKLQVVIRHYGHSMSNRFRHKFFFKRENLLGEIQANLEGPSLQTGSPYGFFDFE